MDLCQLAIAIEFLIQVRYRTKSMNANQIANGVFSALVSITAGCAFVDYWGAVLIGSKKLIIITMGKHNGPFESFAKGPNIMGHLSLLQGGQT